MIDQYFDKIYCINIDRRADRWDKSRIEFKKHGLTVERFSATDGNTENYGLGQPYDNELAGAISHLRAIQKAKESGLDRVLILEDDVEFSDNANELFNQFMTQLPEDWHGLYFGGNHHCGVHQIGQPNVIKMRGSYALQAYTIRPTVLDQTIDYMSAKIAEVVEHRNSAIRHSVAADYFMADLHHSLNFYAFNPPIAWQKEDYSDIQKRIVNYDFLK